MVRNARENSRTVMAGEQGYDLALQRANRTIALARAREAFDASGVRRVDSHRIAWSDGYDTGAMDLADSPDAYAVIGRHSECDVVLANDPRVSLRHLFVKAVRNESGLPALYAGDLSAPLEWVPQPAGASTDAPTGDASVFELGTYVVVLASAGGVTGGSLGGKSAVVVQTRIQSITAVSMLARRGCPAGRLGLRSSTGAAAVRVDSGDLDAGILIGRYGRCVDVQLEGLFPCEVSRCHLLIRGERGGPVAYDLCSSNGTHENGKRVRRVLLRPEGTRLDLAVNEVALEWIAERVS